MKTTEEILYALDCGNEGGIGDCNKCAYEFDDCDGLPSSDAAELIRQLEHERNRFADENRALRTELKVNLDNKYWMNICKMNARQEAKGMEKYGEPLEENTTLTTTQRIEHAQEEAIDLLKYLEHLKQVVDSDGITANDYQRACLRTATSDKSEWLENAIYGIIGEAGEIVDLVKKHKWQGHELDREALILECGDLAWYQALLMSAIDCTLGEAYEKNIEKLKKRYPTGFSKERSVNRDKD